jgi:co-chaperonin GroES (HSP10)
MRERAIFDFVSIAFEKEFEDEHILADGTRLYMDTKSYVSYTASAEGKSQEEDKYEQHRRIYGEIVATPHKLSDHILDRIETGLPLPTRYVSAEFVEAMAKSGERGWGKQSYKAGLFEPDFKRMSDLEMVAQDGDRAYVNFDALTPDKFVGKFQGHFIYYIRYNELICVVRKNHIIMTAEHTLAKPKTISMESSKTASGIYTQSTDKPEYLQAHLWYVAPGNKLGLYGGMEIYYDTHADFKNTIEGEEFYVIKEEDIMLANKKPVGNRILLNKPEEITKKGQIILGRPEKTTISTVVSCGANADQYMPGTRVHFTKGAGTVVEIDDVEYLIVRDTDLLLYEEAHS